MRIWYWCYSCQRCFYVEVPDETEIEDTVKPARPVCQGTGRQSGGPDKCFYPGCNGTREGFRGLGFRRWDFIRKAVKQFHRIEYPKIPKLNKIYPLFRGNQ